MEIKNVGQLRKIIENLSDDYEIEMRVRRKLTDDTDKNQWFTDGDKWILCPEIKFSTYWVYYHIDVNTDTVHKATVNELIEHFKIKEGQ